jgi:hypothetical protein
MMLKDSFSDAENGGLTALIYREYPSQVLHQQDNAS